MKEREAENARLRKMDIDETLRAEVVSDSPSEKLIDVQGSTPRK